MSSDVAEVEKVLQVYFDGLYEGDTRKLGEAFHPASHLYAADGDGKATDWPRADWFKMVESRPSAKAKGSSRAGSNRAASASRRTRGSSSRKASANSDDGDLRAETSSRVRST